MACGKAINECPETSVGEVSILEQYLSYKFFKASILSSEIVWTNLMTKEQVFIRAFISARITKEPDVKLLSAKVTIKCNPEFL